MPYGRSDFFLQISDWAAYPTRSSILSCLQQKVRHGPHFANPLPDQPSSWGETFQVSSVPTGFQSNGLFTGSHGQAYGNEGVCLPPMSQCLRIQEGLEKTCDAQTRDERWGTYRSTTDHTQECSGFKQIRLDRDGERGIYLYLVMILQRNQLAGLCILRIEQ